MPKAPLPAEFEPFLEAPNLAVLATVRPDGSLATTGTWYLWQPETGTVLFNMLKNGPRERNLRANPQLGVTILSESGLDHVSLSGAVVEFRDDPDMVDADRMTLHYMKMIYPKRGIPCTSVIVGVERWHSFGDPVAAGAGRPTYGLSPE